MSDAGIIPDSKSAAPAAGKMRWWQWIILYPSLFVALLGALPTFTDLIKSWSLPVSVPWKKVDQAQEQLNLLMANLSCTQDAASHPLKTHDNVSISAMVCDSGDVVIVAQNANLASYPNPVIVPWKTIVSKGDTAQASWLRPLSPLASAYAQESAPAPSSSRAPSSAQATVICQRLQNDGNFLRRLKTPDGRCIDVLSNVYNRQIIKQTPASCETKC